MIVFFDFCFFFFKQKTAYEMRISDWSSDVCSSDLTAMFFGHGKRVIGKILIVEDEPLVAFENEHVLTHAGYEVVDTVNCCSHAALAIRSTKVDLVVDDIRLTGTRRGIDVAQKAHYRGLDGLQLERGRGGKECD